MSESGSESDGDQRRIAENLAGVRRDLSAACAAAGRDPASVRLIGVSKYVDAATTAMLTAAGCEDLGENRPQLLWQKRESGLIGEDVRWHMIGHVQRNKIRRMLRGPVMVHSIDSRRVAESIGQESVQAGRVTDGLLEVNISGDAEKTGLSIADAREVLSAGRIEGLRWRGLMAMASMSGDAADQFGQVAELRDALERDFDLSLPELSMGMSGDYAPAIAAGATMVRIGTRLFAGVM